MVDLGPPEALAQLEVRLAQAPVGTLDLFAELAVPDEDPDPIARALAAARAADEADFPLIAIATAREAWRRAPARGEAAFRLCALLLKRGDAEAQAVLGQCLSRFPGPSAGWIEIGEALLAARKTAAALVCFARGVPSAALSIRRGLLARDLGRRDEALACFADAVRRDPASARAQFLLGTAAEDLSDLAGAAEAYAQALAIDPALAEAAVNLGIVLQGLGDLTAAKAAYARAVRSHPESFGRIAQALPGAPKGELWLDLAALRRSLAG